MVDQVRADDLVAVEKARELELGADAVRRRDEHAVGAGRREEPAELADLADDLGPLGLLDAIAHAGERVLGAGDIDARGAIGEAHT